MSGRTAGGVLIFDRSDSTDSARFVSPGTLLDMLDKSSPPARRVITLANERASLLGHQHFGTEHILLALCHEQDGIAAEPLRSSDLTPERDSARKLIHLAIQNAVPQWTRTRAWTKALLAFKIQFGDRLPDIAS